MDRTGPTALIILSTMFKNYQIKPGFMKKNIFPARAWMRVLVKQFRPG
jgi:hypothetical protein